MSTASLRARWVALIACGSSVFACTDPPGSGGAGDAGGSSAAISVPKCGPAPTQLVDFRTLSAQVDAPTVAATQLAVDGTNVYFAFNNALMRVPLRGGSVTTMASFATVPNVTGQSVDPIATPASVVLHYLDSGGTNELIVSVPIQGGSAATLATSNGRVNGFTTDGHDVYFLDQGGIESVPLTGGPAQALPDAPIALPGTGFGGTLAVVGANLVMATGAQGGGVVSVPQQGGSPTTLASQQSNASFVMACGPDVCWWTGATPAGVAGSPGPGAIEQLAAGGVPTAIAQAPYFPWSLAFDGTDFFETVGCDICDGTLLRIPASGGPSVSMGSGSFVAVDDACAYSSTSDGIFSVTKSYVAGTAP